MVCNGIGMSLILCRTLGPLVLGWALDHFVLGAQLAPGEKRLVCISVLASGYRDIILRYFFSSGGHVVINIGRGHHEEHFCKIILNLNHWLRRCHLKTFLI